MLSNVMSIFMLSNGASSTHLSTPLSYQAFYFSRDDVALPGFAHFFKENSHEEREHAEKLMAFQNNRGGTIFLQDIKVRSPPMLTSSRAPMLTTSV